VAEPATDATGPARRALRCGFVLPGGTATEQVELAVLAEETGWDGVFVWECAYGVDAWSLLAAIAVRTHRVRVGTLLTPLPWRRPWKVASQVATVDQLSGGRAVLGVGLGALSDDLPLTGEVTELAPRAERLDEGIDLIRALWAGETSYHGRHFDYAGELAGELSAMAQPVQRPIPIWVVGLWPRPKSLRRVLRCDGVVAQYEDGGSPAKARALRRWLDDAGADRLDLIAEGETPANDPAAAAALVAPWSDAGCTWWLETRWEMPHHGPERLAEVRERLGAGPPVPSAADAHAREDR
jgi:alkanesulfonate monooxygenase SsuD/methylene tetrahydromethanopterin reductase-like flavin-dependent oxidoreductase (luciferase family)